MRETIKDYKQEMSKLVFETKQVLMKAGIDAMQIAMDRGRSYIKIEHKDNKITFEVLEENESKD